MIRAIKFHFVNVLIFLAVNLIFGEKFFFVITARGIWIYSLLSILFGYFIGFIIIKFGNYTGNKIYTICLLVTLTGLSLTTLYNKFEDWQNRSPSKRHFSFDEYIEHYPFEYYQIVAINSLRKKISNPKEARIIGTSEEFVDSTFNGVKKHFHLIDINYCNDDNPNYYKAEFLVYKDVAYLSFYDIPYNQKDYDKIENEQKLLDRAIKSLPNDSIDKDIKNLKINQ